MLRKLLTPLLLFAVFTTVAQNPSTVLQIPNKNILLPCGTSCTSIAATVAEIVAETLIRFGASFEITPIPGLEKESP